MKNIAGLTFKILFILLLFAVVFSYAMFQGGFVSWFLFYSFLPILLYVLLFLIYPISNWQVHRHIKQSPLEASQQAEVELTIDRKLPFPIYYCIIEELIPASLHRQDTNREKYRHMENHEVVAQRRVVKKSVFPWFKKNIRITYQLELLPRGDHQLQAVRIRCGDFFGFVKKERTYDVCSRLLVFPSKREVSLSEKASSMEGGNAASFNMQAKSSNVVTGVREYAPGDRFSWIDWKTTARRNTVMTKEFEQEKSTSVLLFLDSVAYEGMNKLAYEGSVELTASLVESLRKSDSSFSFISLGKEKKIYPFQMDPVKKKTILQHLAEIEPGENEAFGRLLQSELTKLPSGAIMMVVTTKMDAEMKQAIDRARRKSKRVVVFFIKPGRAVSLEERNLIRELNGNGVIVNLVTEEKLIQKKFEVKT